MTSTYGRNNYIIWMKNNKDIIIYDKDDGIIKKELMASGYNCQRALILLLKIICYNLIIMSNRAYHHLKILISKNNTSNLAPTREYFEGKANNKILNPNEISQLVR